MTSVDLSAGAEAGSVQYDRNRAAILETLFELDGRSHENHPHRHCYTALVEDCRARIGADQLEAITRAFHLGDGPGTLRSALEAAPQ